MNTLVELIKRIGIFMVAAQAVIHFAPEHKYEKYIKLIVGIMVLLQFLSPFYKITGGTEPDWGALLSDMETEVDADGMLGEIAKAPSIEDAVIANIEQEIKSKLNESLADEKYRVVNVVVHLTAENGTDRYSFDMVRVAVQAYTNDTYQGTDRIQIRKITLEGNSEDGQNEVHTDNRQDSADTLRKKFCEILGMEEDYMEVSVYGTIEETDK